MSNKKRTKRPNDDDDDDYDPGESMQQDDDGDWAISGEDFTASSRAKRGSASGKGKKGAKAGLSQSFSQGQGSAILNCTGLKLKDDHAQRPCWIFHNHQSHPKENIIMLEAFSSIYQKAYDFLVSIADPVARPKYIHRYKLTSDSLYAAVALGQTKDDIVRNLDILCKTEVPREVVEFIEQSTESFGKAKLVLKDNKYRIEAVGANGMGVLRDLLTIPVVREARLLAKPAGDARNGDNESYDIMDGDNKRGFEGDFGDFEVSLAPAEDSRNIVNMAAAIDDDDDDDDMFASSSGNASVANDTGGKALPFGFNGVGTLQTSSFMIRDDMVQIVKQRSKEMYPLLEEYDYKGDTKNPTLGIEMKPTTVARIRPHQQKALLKMFGNGRARSGVIVLPCGAGKTLTGISALATIKKSAVILCINNVSVQQWKNEIMKWCAIQEGSIKLFCNFGKELLPENEACIVLTTYSMMAHDKKSEASKAILAQMDKREWGLLLLDEVHVAPADTFQKVIGFVKAHTKLGLTATLVREDGKISDLQYLVGPKLYEANWINLTEQGYLAKVECNEVWCPMSPDFFREYVDCTNERQKRLLYALNPRKLKTCLHLINKHRKEEGASNKILIFCDDIPVLRLYCKLLPCEYLDGTIKMKDRQRLLDDFRTPGTRVLGLSRVGDIALDLPEANIIVQVTSQFGSNRQEAQRLGRILRPKPNASGDGSGGSAIFYSLISKNTKEMYFASKRQKYLIDQGYTFNVRTDISEDAEVSGNTYSIDKKTEGDILSWCKGQGMTEARQLDDVESGDKLLDADESEEDADDYKGFTSSKGSLGSLSRGGVGF